jgi:hypothetical protein
MMVEQMGMSDLIGPRALIKHYANTNVNDGWNGHESKGW